MNSRIGYALNGTPFFIILVQIKLMTYYEDYKVLTSDTLSDLEKQVKDLMHNNTWIPTGGIAVTDGKSKINTSKGAIFLQAMKRRQVS